MRYGDPTGCIRDDIAFGNTGKKKAAKKPAANLSKNNRSSGVQGSGSRAPRAIGGALADIGKHSFTKDTPGRKSHPPDGVSGGGFAGGGGGGGGSSWGYYINGQGRDAYASIPFGDGTVGGNGCGAIAAYNALVSQGITDVTLEDTIEYLENNDGMTLDFIPGASGLMGARPWVINEFLQEQGINSHLVPFHPTSSLDNKAKKASAIIIQFGYFVTTEGENYGIVGGHYVLAQYDEETGEYLIYNSYNLYETERSYASINDYLHAGQMQMNLSVIIIP